MNQVATLQGNALVPEKTIDNRDVLKSQMTSNKKEFESVLPSHISFEKFQRVVMTAVTQNPDLMTANRQSLLFSATKCATDGLLPDGREAAFVIFNSKDGKDEHGKDKWIKKVQYMPMWFGLLKKIRQSKELSSVVAHVVYQIEIDKKLFSYVLGDDERIEHQPYIGSEPRGKIAAAYAIARLKDGTVIREVMTFEEIEKIRSVSKSGADSKTKGPIGIWRDWYEEMARKTVFRRLAKWLPQSTEIIERVFENDDSMSIIDSVNEDAATVGDKPLTITEQKANLQIENQPDLKMEIIKDKQEEGVPLSEEKNPEEQKKEELTDIEKIKQSIIGAKSEQELGDLWEVDLKSKLEELNQFSPEDYAELVGIMKARQAQIKTGQLV